MKRLTQALTAFAVTLVCAGPTLAQSWKSDDLKPKDECRAHAKDALRCVAQGAGTVEVTLSKTASASGKKVSFSYDEYHSGCGFASAIMHGETVTIPAESGSWSFFTLGSGSNIGCREVFILRCKLDGADGNCQELLTPSLQRYKGNQQ